jgi:hypothetical protein
VFGTEQEAMAHFLELARRKHRKGYRPTGGCGTPDARHRGAYGDGSGHCRCRLCPCCRSGKSPQSQLAAPGHPGPGQQAFGDHLLGRHRFIAIRSPVSPHSWNLILLAGGATGAYALEFQEAFALDTRLHPPTR